MNGIPTPLQVIITAPAGLLNRYQANVIDYFLRSHWDVLAATDFFTVAGHVCVATI